MDNSINFLGTQRSKRKRNLTLPTEFLFKKGYLKGKILDYGCGKAQDKIALSNMGFNCIGYDKYNKEYSNTISIDEKFDTIICNFVLNVIPNIEERNQVIQSMKLMSKNVYISVRSDLRCIKPHWNKYNDGYMTKNNTFQKIYTVEELFNEFGKVEVLKKTETFILFRI